MYRLYAFGTKVLPDAASEYTEEIAAPDGAVAVIGGGVYDSYGSRVVQPRLPATIRYRGTIRGSTVAAVRTSLESYLALIGTKANLSRSALDDAEEIVCSARLMAVQRVHKPVNYFGKHEVLDFTFQLLSRWRGAARNSVTELTVGESSKAITFYNYGNRRQEEIRISVTAGSAALSMFGVDLPTASCSWRWTGSLAAGETLVIDCGAKSVLKNGIDDWNGFAMTGNHGIEPWLSVANVADDTEGLSGSFVYTDNAAGATPGVVTVTMYDAWM